MPTRKWLLGLLSLLAIDASRADVTLWQLGGSGFEWSASDTSRVFIDFETTPGAIQPAYLSKDRNILSQLSDWTPLKFPRELGYVDGERPRIWRAADGFFWYTAGTLTTSWVDGDSITYSPPVSRGITSEWYTIDIGVPVPADRFGFFTPPRGFRADGTLLNDDIVKAFELSISGETDPVLLGEKTDRDYHPLETVIADVPQNFERDVMIDFPRQYVRFMRFKRNISIDDLDLQSGTWGPEVQQGTIGEFVLLGEGVPKRVFYTTRITDLGQQVNFGRLFWSTTPMRVIDGAPVEAPDAKASVIVEARSGRDEDPVLYYEYTDAGEEFVVPRDRFEHDLKPPDPLYGNSNIVQEGKPGLRASIRDDSANWTFWSFPITQSGMPLPLERGRFLQVRVTLESGAFADFVRLDSLWIEVSPPLARRVLGEVARLDNPNPARGFTEVELGAMTEFTYDIKAEFDATGQGGFDAVRIRTGNSTSFKGLAIGESLTPVDPVQVVAEADGLLLQLPQKITNANNQPLRVIFATEIFVFANTFQAEVVDSESSDLPQQIEAGDASAQVGTNDLRVWGATGETIRVIENLRFSTPILTPNGDGINDRLAIEYTLFRLPDAIPVELVVYDLSGARVARIAAGKQNAGTQRIFWDGRDELGRLLRPGTYLVDLSVRAELEIFRHLQPVGIAY